MLDISPIPAFDDNYIWLLSDSESRRAYVVDPGEAAPVVSALEQQRADTPANASRTPPAWRSTVGMAGIALALYLLRRRSSSREPEEAEVEPGIEPEGEPEPDLVVEEEPAPDLVAVAAEDTAEPEAEGVVLLPDARPARGRMIRRHEFTVAIDLEELALSLKALADRGVDPVRALGPASGDETLTEALGAATGVWVAAPDDGVLGGEP